jgi:hypothetical protein
MIRRIYYGIIIFFSLAFGLFTCVGSFFEDMCGNEILQELTAPYGKWKAVIFSRNCGATTGYSTHVSILPTTQPLTNTAGNVLITDIYASSPADESLPLEVQWLSRDTLSIRYAATAKTFTQAIHFEEISIHYEVYENEKPASTIHNANMAGSVGLK